MKYLVVLIGMAGLVNFATADIVPFGDPFDGNSWGQRFQESGVGQFDFLAVQMNSSGDAFEAPVFRNFSAGGWSSVFNSSTLATASGTSLTSLEFDLIFAGANTNSLEFTFVAFRGNTLLESARASWNGSGWSVTAGAWTPSRQSLENLVVPVPGAALLGVLGLGIAGWVKRRMA